MYLLMTKTNVLCFQREQMLEAQSMFKTANKITRAEKALILGFMAGSRGDNRNKIKRSTNLTLKFCCFRKPVSASG